MTSGEAEQGDGARSADATQWSVIARHAGFRRLFAGTSVSLLGSSVTTVALPLVAVVMLGASPLEMGILGAAAFLPHVVLGLPAGVWVSRWPFRRVIVGADLISALALACVPILGIAGALEMWHLFVLVVITGTCGLFSAVASQSFTPLLVPRRDLLAANGAMAMSSSVVSTTGSALGGVLVQLLTAPIAIAVDAVSLLVSAAMKARIPSDARGHERAERASSMLRGIAAGLHIVLRGSSTLRATTIAATVGAMAGQMQAVVLVLFLVRSLDLSPGTVGAAIAVSGAAGILGAVIGVPISRRLGSGPTFILGMLVSSAAGIVLALAAGPFVLVANVVVAAQLLRGWGPTLYGINQQTIRQTLVPPHRLAQAQATWRFLVFGVQPIGALLGGVLGTALGFRATLVISSLVMLLGVATAVLSPLRRMREVSEESSDPVLG
jgi:MFS family permease